MTTLFRARTLLPWRVMAFKPYPTTAANGTLRQFTFLLQARIAQDAGWRQSLQSFSTSAPLQSPPPPITTPVPNHVVPEKHREDHHQEAEEETKHAVVSTFDLFSIGIGPSSRYVHSDTQLHSFLGSQWADGITLGDFVQPRCELTMFFFSIVRSHTVGPMRAAKIFVTDLKTHDVLEKVVVSFFCLLLFTSYR